MRSIIFGVTTLCFGDYRLDVTIGKLSPLDLLTGDLQSLAYVFFVQGRLYSLLNQEKYFLALGIVDMERPAFVGQSGLALFRGKID